MNVPVRSRSDSKYASGGSYFEFKGKVGVQDDANDPSILERQIMTWTFVKRAPVK